jgi:hypothetical protein
MTLLTAYEFNEDDFPQVIGRNDQPTGWRYVGDNPHRYFYPCDRDAEVMDHTNWTAAVGDAYTADSFDEAEREHFDVDLVEFNWAEVVLAEEGLSLTGLPRTHTPGVYGATFVRDGSELHEHLLSCSRALADYPLLDEEAYSEQEYEAWQEYWVSDAARDTLRDALNIIDPDDELEVEDLYAFDPVGIVGMAALSCINYENGFTGEYDDNGAVAGMVAALNGIATVLALLRRAFRDTDRLADGILPLPLGGDA